MEQIARNLTDCDEGFLTGRRFFIVDHDALYSPRIKATLRGSGIEILLTAYQAPNMNAYAERFVRSIKLECLDQRIFLGQDALDRAIAEYVAHYHGERSHQGLGNEAISGAEPRAEGAVQARERLGGLLKYYYRTAV